MNNPNRSTLIAKLQKVLKKHYKPIIPPQRSLLDSLLYACCLENAHFDKADEAFARLQEAYFDWNEVRVTSAMELAELFGGLPQPQAAAHRVKRTLQGIFDNLFTFDEDKIEPLKKQNLGKTVKDLEKFGATPFAVAFVTQSALGGHAIAADEATFDVLVITGILNDAEAAKGLLPGIERAVPKNKGPEFFSELHQLAADFFLSPNSTRVRGILGEIGTDIKERIAARQVTKQEEAVAHAKAAARERERQQAEMFHTPLKPAPAKESAKDKPAGKGAAEAKEKGKESKAKAAKPAAEKPKEREKEREKAPSEKRAAPGKKAAEESKKKPAEAPKSSKKKVEESAKKPVSKGLSKKKPR